MPNLTLALWQTPYAASPTHALQHLENTAANAKARGADLLLCPEMSLTGYALGAQSVKDLAEAADGPMSQAVASITRRHQIAIVYGYPEQHPEGLQPFNATQCIDHEGQPIAHYRKTHLFGDMDHQQFTAGDAPSQLFVYRDWLLGLLICYDVEFPETVRMLALQGADAVLVPTANMVGFDEVPQLLVPARACENRLYVAYANACGNEGLISYGGLSTLASPDGQPLVLADAEATILFHNLEASALARSRKSAQRPHRRPSLYGPLSVPDTGGANPR